MKLYKCQPFKNKQMLGQQMSLMKANPLPLLKPQLKVSMLNEISYVVLADYMRPEIVS